MHRLYENEDITVFWDSGKCYHAKRCVTGCPQVFDIQRKPWIDISKAPNADIWQTVTTCPSGALTITYNHEVQILLDDQNNRSIAKLNDNIIGECDYEITEKGWRIYHTEVSPEYTGKNIAKRLVYKVVEAAEKNRADIIPVCSYAAKILN